MAEKKARASIKLNTSFKLRHLMNTVLSLHNLKALVLLSYSPSSAILKP